MESTSQVLSVTAPVDQNTSSNATSAPETSLEKVPKSKIRRIPGIPRRFYVTLRNIGLIFFIAFPIAHMASWALSIWMIGRAADKLAASLDTTKPFDDIVFRNTLRRMVVAGAKGWRINVIMLSLETLCAIIGGCFLIRGLRRARRLIIEVEDKKDLEGQDEYIVDRGTPAVL